MRQTIFFDPETEWLEAGEVEIVQPISTKAEDKVPQMYLVQYLDRVCKPVLAFADELFIEAKEGEPW